MNTAQNFIEKLRIWFFATTPPPAPKKTKFEEAMEQENLREDVNKRWQEMKRAACYFGEKCELANGQALPPTPETDRILTELMSAAIDWALTTTRCVNVDMIVAPGCPCRNCQLLHLAALAYGLLPPGTDSHYVIEAFKNLARVAKNYATASTAIRKVSTLETENPKH